MVETGCQAGGQGSGRKRELLSEFRLLVVLVGLLHQKWEDNWQKGGAAAQGRVLPHRGDDELTGEGQGGAEATLRMKNLSPDLLCVLCYVLACISATFVTLYDI